MTTALLRPITVVAVGGALGAVLRWTLGEWLPDGAGFPWTTFAINVSGSFLLALLPALDVVRRQPLLPLFLGTGMLGGFTTLSTYAEQARVLLVDGDQLLAGAYLGGTLAAALAAVHLARVLTTPGQRTTFHDEEGDE